MQISNSIYIYIHTYIIHIHIYIYLVAVLLLHIHGCLYTRLEFIVLAVPEVRTSRHNGGQIAGQLKPLGGILLWCSRGIHGVPNWVPMMPRDDVFWCRNSGAAWWCIEDFQTRKTTTKKKKKYSCPRALCVPASWEPSRRPPSNPSNITTLWYQGASGGPLIRHPWCREIQVSRTEEKKIS